MSIFLNNKILIKTNHMVILIILFKINQLTINIEICKQ